MQYSGGTGGAGEDEVLVAQPDSHVTVNKRTSSFVVSDIFTACFCLLSDCAAGPRRVVVLRRRNVSAIDAGRIEHIGCAGHLQGHDRLGGWGWGWQLSIQWRPFFN